MSEEEKKALELIKINNKHRYCDKDDVDFLLNLIEKQQKELEQEKEKNKELEKYKTYYEEMEEVNKKFIAVDKIKEKIEETNSEKLNYSEDEYYLENEVKGYAIDKLKELLEEK